jgi:hypothetical protein
LWRRFGKSKGLQQIIPRIEDQKGGDRREVAEERAAWSEFFPGCAPELITEIASGMKSEGQKVEGHKDGGQVLLAVTEIMLEMVAFGFQYIE